MKDKALFIACLMARSAIAVIMMAAMLLFAVALCACGSHRAVHSSIECSSVEVSDSINTRVIYLKADSLCASESAVFSFDSLKVYSLTDVGSFTPAVRDGSPKVSVVDVKGGRLVVSRDLTNSSSLTLDASKTLARDSISSMKSDVFTEQPEEKKGSSALAWALVAAIIIAFAVIWWLDWKGNKS